VLSELFIIVLGIIIILLIVYIYVREQDFNKKFRILASKSDTMSRQIHIINKNFSRELTKHREEIAVEVGNYVEAEINQQRALNNNSEDMEQVKEAIDRLAEEVNSLRELNKRVHLLESGMKTAVLDRHSAVDNTQQIISYYQQGYPVDEISKTLRVSRREVEFALKLAKVDF
jgi:uncharacterized protein YoxC